MLRKTQKHPDVLTGQEWSGTPREKEVRPNTDLHTFALKIEPPFVHWRDTMTPGSLWVLIWPRFSPLYLSHDKHVNGYRLIFFFNKNIRRYSDVYNSLCLLSPYGMLGTVLHALHVGIILLNPHDDCLKHALLWPSVYSQEAPRLSPAQG